MIGNFLEEGLLGLEPPEMISEIESSDEDEEEEKEEASESPAIF